MLPCGWPGRPLGASRARKEPESVTVTGNNDIYYDPYDFEIDADPYPIWKRMRDETPLYYNEKFEFYALSRFDDVDRASRLGHATGQEGVDPGAHPPTSRSRQE